MFNLEQLSTWTHLDADNDDKGRCCCYCKSLVVCQRDSIALCGVRENTVRNEEQNNGSVDSLSDTDKELSLVKQQVQLAWLIQLWIL